MTIIGSGVGESVITEYAQTFARGAVPAGKTVVAGSLPTQMDARTHWPDGSVRHAQLAVRVPPLAAGASLELPQRVIDASTTTMMPPSVRAVTVTVTVTVTPITGTPWVYQVAEETPADVRRDGPLVCEMRYIASVPVAACGSAGMRLILDVTEAVDGVLTVDMALRNDVCLNSGTVPCSYAVALSMDGVQQFQATVADHGRFAALVRRRRTLPGGAVAPAVPTVRPDIDYLADIGVLPRLDWRLGLDAGYLPAIRTAMAAPAWGAPFAARGVTQYMPMTGGRGDIGVVPAWVAAWLISGDRDALNHTHDISEALAGCPWHYWDGVNGRWLNNTDRPGLWADYRDSRWTPQAGTSSWTPDRAHAPDACSALYALTGRRSALDGLLAQAAYCIMAASPSYVRLVNEPHPWAGVGIINTQQMRAAAWSLRFVAHAAALAPTEDQPHGDYFTNCVHQNFAWWQAKTPEWNAALGEVAGLPPVFDYGEAYHIAPWQGDHLGAVLAQITAMGLWPAAESAARWHAQWSAQRFLRADFSPGLGIGYKLRAWSNTWVPLNSWAAIDSLHRAAGGYPGNPPNWASMNENDYPPLAMQALAALSDVLPDEPALLDAFNMLRSKPIPTLTTAALRSAPQKNVVPRGFTRAAQ